MLKATLLSAAAALATVSGSAHAQVGQAAPGQAGPDRFQAVSPGFYVKGDLGFSFSPEDEIDYSPLWGLGVGYRLTPNLRTDFTVTWRDRYVLEAGQLFGGATFDSVVENQTYMLNAYYDFDQFPLFTLPGGFKPFVGLGLGLSHTEVDDDVVRGGEDNLINEVFGDEDTQLAWQAMAGVAYQLNPNLAFELMYRFVSLGDIEADSPLGDIDESFNANEIVASVRYNF